MLFRATDKFVVDRLDFVEHALVFGVNYPAVLTSLSSNSRRISFSVRGYVDPREQVSVRGGRLAISVIRQAWGRRRRSEGADRGGLAPALETRALSAWGRRSHVWGAAVTLAVGGELDACARTLKFNACFLL